MDVLLHGAWRVAWRLGFALLGESLFPDAEKVTKNALPLHPALRFAPGAFTTPWLRGSPYKGHPWPFTALATSLRLAPLRDGSVHPPEGAFGVACWAARAEQPDRFCLRILSGYCIAPKPLQRLAEWTGSTALLGFLRTSYQATPFAPFRRPSGIVAEGSERHGCRERRKGPWMALVRRPPEQRWNEGSRAQRDPDGGARLFGSFWGDCQKELAQQGETKLPSTSPIDKS